MGQAPSPKAHQMSHLRSYFLAGVSHLAVRHHQIEQARVEDAQENKTTPPCGKSGVASVRTGVAAKPNPGGDSIHGPQPELSGHPSQQRPGGE
jgi:hypothetical protein